MSQYKSIYLNLPHMLQYTHVGVCTYMGFDYPDVYRCLVNKLHMNSTASSPLVAYEYYQRHQGNSVLSIHRYTKRVHPILRISHQLLQTLQGPQACNTPRAISEVIHLNKTVTFLGQLKW